jgi:hypothetical protein
MVALRISLSLNKQQAEKPNQFSGHMAFTNLNEPNENAIIVHDGVLLEDGMRTVTS